MAKLKISSKHLQINKANSVITLTLAIASFVAVASLVASRAMLQQRSYQAKVIKEKELAAKTLKDNIAAVDTLVNAYKEFVGRPDNIIGGSTAGTGERDGDNAKIVLDALPSKYDFPALTTSLEKILTQGNFKINNISGIDDEVGQGAKQSSTPELIEIPFTFSVSGNYDSLNSLIQTLENSIRPIKIDKLKFSIQSSEIQMDIDAKTFYQSEKTFTITTKEVR
jgi:hypothetical protein